MLIADAQLSRIILENQLLSSNQLKTAQEVSGQGKIPLYRAILEKDLIKDEELGQVIADYLKVPFINLSKTTIDERILRTIPEIVSKKQQIIAFSKDEQGLKVAMADPTNSEFKNFLEKKTGDKILVYFATERDIAEVLSLYKKNLQARFDEIIKSPVEKAGKSSASDIPVAQIVDLLIEYAYQNKASDIHIEPEEDKSLVRYRIDGVLHDVLTFPRNLHDQMITRIKVLSRLRTDEHLSAQDGKMQAKLEQENLDIRVSIVPIVNGEKGVLRLLSSRTRQFALSDLGVEKKDLVKITGGFNKPFGMVLGSGPTGSGKTTTIYAILKIINTREKNIATIEDPVEYDIESINQIQVNPKTNLTFADGLRSILRQDPDIIFVGEIRDKETASIAVNAAMTGHLVLSTIHTNNAATSLPRLIDMNIEPFLIASTVNVIIAQRLVRKICEKCKISQILKIENGQFLTIDPNLSQLLNSQSVPIKSKQPPKGSLSTLSKLVLELLKLFGSKGELRIYKGKGCPLCHFTGYVGRIGIFEVIAITEPIRRLILAKVDAQTIEVKAQEEGMTTMLADGLAKVAKGVTTIEEVVRATKE